MAERRMLHRKVSVSADLAALDEKHGPRAVLFYTWLIPHLDRWGCATADPGTLLAKVGPRWQTTTTAEVKAWLDWMVRRGLLERVNGAHGERGVRVPRFHDHQSGTHWDREAPSPFEPPDVTKRWERGRKTKSAYKQAGPGLVQDRSGSGPSEGKVIRPSPLPPKGAPAEAGESPPGGEHHRLAPRPDVHHDDAEPNGNGRKPTRYGELQSAAEVLAHLKAKGAA